MASLKLVAKPFASLFYDAVDRLSSHYAKVNAISLKPKIATKQYSFINTVFFQYGDSGQNFWLEKLTLR